MRISPTANQTASGTSATDRAGADGADVEFPGRVELLLAGVDVVELPVVSTELGGSVEVSVGLTEVQLVGD